MDAPELLLALVQGTGRVKSSAWSLHPEHSNAHTLEHRQTNLPRIPLNGSHDHFEKYLVVKVFHFGPFASDSTQHLNRKR